MKALVCEMCNGNQLVKVDGLFQCQSCGTKYSVEEAKKLMFDGPVDVVGTIKIDKSDNLVNLIVMIKNSIIDTRYDEAYKYCSDALLISPNHPEVIVLQGLASLGMDNSDYIIPPSTINSLKRLKNVIHDFDMPISEKREMLADLKKYPVEIIRHKNSVYNDQVNALKAQKSPRNPQNNAKIDKLISEIVRKKEQLSRFVKDFDKQIDATIESVNTKEVDKKSVEVEKYWEEHKEEKVSLETELLDLNSQLDKVKKEKLKLVNDVQKLKDVMNSDTPLELERKSLVKEIEVLEASKRKLNIFQNKEKKEIDIKVSQIRDSLPSVSSIESQKRMLKVEKNKEINEIKKVMDQYKETEADLVSRINRIKDKLLFGK